MCLYVGLSKRRRLIIGPNLISGAAYYWALLGLNNTFIVFLICYELLIVKPS